MHSITRSIRVAALFVVFVSATFLSNSCRTAGSNDLTATKLNSAGAPSGSNNVMALPTLSDSADLLTDTMTSIRRNRPMPPGQLQAYAKKVSHYLAFLGLKPNTKTYDAVLSRLLSSSTQFILCDDFENWECLERVPEIKPGPDFRVDTSSDLGTPMIVNDTFHMEAFLTDQWDKNSVDFNHTLARRLASKIDKFGNEGIWMALYGIDEIQGSMKPVYNAIVQKLDKGVPVAGVFDNGGFNKSASFPLIFTYKQINDPNWIFANASDGRPNLEFQYKATIELINRMNQNSSSDLEGPARLEKPDTAIMHNKFMVFKSNNQMSVWTGTANISDTCMGSDRNSNMGVFIEQNEIAKVFLDEFNEMYTPMATPFSDPKKRYMKADGTFGIPVGAFHNAKRPNTKRYFKFSDGNEVRVHFAPTDDAEHRVLIPMILAAQPGDKLRIAMFGGGGYEFVRAFQYAAAKGVTIQIVFDRFTGSGGRSWIKSDDASVIDANPYSNQPTSEIEVRLSTWKGLNHHKTATLSRVINGTEQPIMMTIGSQNWSITGNDENDENMITIRNTVDPIPAGVLFNQHFDARLWPASAAGVVTPANNAAPAASTTTGP